MFCGVIVYNSNLIFAGTRVDKKINRIFALKYLLFVQTSNPWHQKKWHFICKQLVQLLIWKTRSCVQNHEFKNHGNAVTAQRIILLLSPMFKVVYHCFQKCFVHKNPGKLSRRYFMTKSQNTTSLHQRIMVAIGFLILHGDCNLALQMASPEKA